MTELIDASHIAMNALALRSKPQPLIYR